MEDGPAATSADDRIGPTVGTGGSLPAGTYDYGVTALTATGETTISPVHAYSVSAGGKVALKLGGPVGATGYRIYGGTSAHLQLGQLSAT